MLNAAGLRIVSFSFLKRALPLFCLAAVSCLVTALTLHQVNNWDYPLCGEYLTTPFWGELLKRSLSVWDAHFGLGFSNILNSPGPAPYVGGYSGSVYVASFILNTVFQAIGPSFFLNQAAGLFLLSLGIYWILRGFQSSPRTGAGVVLLSMAITVLVYTTDMITAPMASGARFAIGLGLMIMAFFHYRRLLTRGSEGLPRLHDFIPFLLCAASLLLFFHIYFIPFLLLIGFQGVIGWIWVGGKKKETAVQYIKIAVLSGALIPLVFGYVIGPLFLSRGQTLIAGEIGRLDTPMAMPLSGLWPVFNSSVSDHFGWVSQWMPFVLAVLGVLFVLLLPVRRNAGYISRQWAVVDLLSFCLFVFLAKGSAPPLADVNQWLHTHVPFFKVLGSSYPYIGIINMLAVYYLIYGVHRIFELIRMRWTRLGSSIAWVFVTAVLIICVFRSHAFMSGDFGGRIQSIQYPTEYYAFKQTAEKAMQEGRTYYFPDRDALIGWHYSYSPPMAIGSSHTLPFSSTFPIDIQWSNFNKNSGFYGQTMAYLMNHFQDGNQLARVLAAADTKYVVFDMSLKETSPAVPRMRAVRNQVRTSPLFVLRSELSNRFIEVYENRAWRQAAFLSKKTTLSTDNPAVFLESGDVMTFSSALPLPEALRMKRENIFNWVLLYNSDETGLMLDRLYVDYEIKPSAHTLRNDGLSHWHTNNSVYQTQFTEVYGGRFLGRHPIASYSEGARAVYFAKVARQEGHRLFIRAVVSPDSGGVLVHVNGDKRPVDLRSNGYTGLQWFDVGEVPGGTGRVQIIVESKEKSLAKRIDVVALFPEKDLVESSAMMKQLIEGIEVVRLETPGYLQWKEESQKGTPAFSPSSDSHRVLPKILSVTNQHFFLQEDFDCFDGRIGREAYNLLNINPIPVKEKNFVRSYAGLHHQFVGSAQEEAGTYAMVYGFVSREPFSDLKVMLRTACVSPEGAVHFYGSDNGLSWVKMATRTSDAEGHQPLDMSAFARGKKKIYLKIVYEKLVHGLGSIYLLGVNIHGATDKEESLDKVVKGESVTPMEGMEGPVDGPGIAVIDKGFDPRWRMGDLRSFPVGYGFSGFALPIDGASSHLYNDGKCLYRALLFWSASFYLFLCLALIWKSVRCQRF